MCNSICWHALMLKNIILSNTAHYCRSSMPHLSQTLRFLQSPPFRQAQSVLIGQLIQSIVIGPTPQALVGNVTPLTTIESFSFQNKYRQLIMSFVLTSVQAQEGNIVAWQKQWWCSNVFANKPRLCDCVSLSHTREHTHTQTHTHTHTYTHDSQYSAFEQSIANT